MVRPYFLCFQIALDPSARGYVSSDSPMVLFFPLSSLGLDCQYVMGVLILYGCIDFGCVVAILGACLLVIPTVSSTVITGKSCYLFQQGFALPPSRCILNWKISHSQFARPYFFA